MKNPVASASVTLFARYRDLLETAPFEDTKIEGCSREHLRWMCTTAIESANDWPVDKLSRWLGFIQGVLTMQGVLTVAGERDFSRPLFHAAYSEQGMAAPKTVERQVGKNTMTLTEDEVHTAYGVLMDKTYQDELMNNPDHPEIWALDYVYDSSLRALLDSRAAMLGLTT